MIERKIYNGIRLKEREILRYAEVKNPDAETLRLLEECRKELGFECCLSVCYKIFDVDVERNVCNFRDFSVVSDDLANLLSNSSRALIFGATAGHELDRVITKYSRVSPSRALMFQAIGTEIVESGCDVFLCDVAQKNGFSFTPRFSAGYGDLPLTFQKDIFTYLDLTKQNGMYLNDSLIMSPSKSVTAIVGIKNKT